MLFRSVANAFRGIKIAVAVLMISVAVKMLRNMKKKKLPVAIMVGSLIAMLAINFFELSVSSIYIIIVAGFIGYLAFVVEQMNHGDRSVNE